MHENPRVNPYCALPDPVDLSVEGIRARPSLPRLTIEKPCSEVTIAGVIEALKGYGSGIVNFELESATAEHSGFYADVYFVLHHDQRALAVKMIGGVLGATDSLSTSVENLGSDIDTLLEIRGTELESLFPKMFAIVNSSDNQPVALVTEVVPDHKKLFDAIKDGDVTLEDAREQIESILKQLEGHGLYLWDTNQDNFSRTPAGNWIIMDPGSLATKEPENVGFNRNNRLDGLFKLLTPSD